jgi:membrane protein
MSDAATAKPAKGTNASWFAITKQAGADWVEDKSTKLAAALAFYTMLSIAPLLIITVKIIGKFLDAKTTQSDIQGYLVSNMGQKAADALLPAIEQAKQPGGGVIATTVSVVILLLSASGVFGELQDSLNTIWEVKPRPNRGIWTTIKERFFSFTLVLGVAFLMLVSLIASTVISGLANHLGGEKSFFWEAMHFVISLGVITGLFALIFRYLPDVRTAWRPVLVGAAATAVLFTIGKFVLGWYLGRQATTSMWGAFSSLVALLLWVYYSSQILFFGAEFTQAYAKATGYDMTPMPNAVPITEEDRAQQGIASPERVAVKTGSAVPLAGRPRPRVVNVPVYGPRGMQPLATYALAGAGLVVGAIAGAFGANNLKKDPKQVTRRTAAAVNLDKRIHAIESRLGRVSRLRGYLDTLSVSDRIDEVEDRLRHATTTLRAQKSGRPRWMVRLGEKVAGA